MANQDPLGPSQYFHQATAFGIAGQIERPTQQTIQTQAGVSLAPNGGRGTERVENFNAPGFVSFRTAYTHVGGSFDQPQNTHATYACAVVEDLDICGIMTADRVVSRLSVYCTMPDDPDQPPPYPSFSIVGSYFENLRIAGQKIDIKLATQPFNNETYSDFHGAGAGKGKKHKYRPWMLGSHIADQLDGGDQLKDKAAAKKLEHNCSVVSAIGKRFRLWENSDQNHTGPYWCSAVDASALAGGVSGSDLTNFGGIICVPRFGVIYLAELLIHHDHRRLNMLRVHMCSTLGGNVTGPTSTGGGSSPTGPGN